MGPLNNENKLKVDKKNNKNLEVKKNVNINNIINFKSICYKLSASRNFIHSMLNSKLIRPLLSYDYIKSKNQAK